MFDIIELVEGNLQSMLDSGEVECPSADCDNRRFSVSIWNGDEEGLVGTASCRDCELRIDLDLDDETVERAEAAVEAFRARHPSDPPVDPTSVETAE
jgi:hypothetical protein